MRKSTLIVLIIFLVSFTAVCVWFTIYSEIVGDCPEVPSAIQKTMVWIKYEVTGKNEDGSYFERDNTGSGIIYRIEDDRIFVITNKHVVDCFHSELGCYQRVSEIIRVRTDDDKLYLASGVFYAQHDIDIALLEIKTPNAKEYTASPIKFSGFVKWDKVTAIGYPSFARETSECSISTGKITGVKKLLSDTGFEFTGIGSDAYSYYGSSGGGLFDEYENLIGITTWLSANKKDNIAIGIDIVNKSEFYSYCESGSYLQDKDCIKYCRKDQILGKDKKCYSECYGFYCISDNFGGRYTCSEDETLCHLPCGSLSLLCEKNNYCYKNKCIYCPTGTILFENGECRYKI